MPERKCIKHSRVLSVTVWIVIMLCAGIGGADEIPTGNLWLPTGTMYTSDDGSTHPYHCPDFDLAAEELLGVSEFYFLAHDPDAVLEWGGITRYYDYYIPSDIPAGHKLPLLFVFHGGSTDNYKMYCNLMAEMADYLKLADQWKFIVVFPNGTDPQTQLSAARSGENGEHSFHWNDCRVSGFGGAPNSGQTAPTLVTTGIDGIDDVGLIAGQGGLIDVMTTKLAQKGLAVDQDRVYVTGASNGGMMTLRCAIEAPDRIVAAAAFISLFFYDYSYQNQSGETVTVECECTEPWNITQHMPLFLLNGSGDNWVNWNSGFVLGWFPTQQYSKERCLPWLDKKPIYSGYGLAPSTYLSMLEAGQLGYQQIGDTFADLWSGTLVSTGEPTGIDLDWFYLAENPHIQTCFFTAKGSGHDTPTVQAEALRDACLYGDHIQGSFETPDMAWLFLQQYRFDEENTVICDPMYDDPDAVDCWCEQAIAAASAPTAKQLKTMWYRHRNAWKNRHP